MFGAFNLEQIVDDDERRAHPHPPKGGRLSDFGKPYTWQRIGGRSTHTTAAKESDGQIIALSHYRRTTKSMSVSVVHILSPSPSITHHPLLSSICIPCPCTPTIHLPPHLLHTSIDIDRHHDKFPSSTHCYHCCNHFLIKYFCECSQFVTKTQLLDKDLSQ